MKALKYLKSNRGSSSVLVILIMVTLIVFGMLALMSSYADLKLAQKSASWTSAYYLLDSQGEDLVQQIDTCLAAAQAEADQYMTDNAYTKNDAGQIPDIIQKQISSGWSQYKGQGESEKKYLDTIYQKLYFYLAAQKLEAAAQNNFKITYKNNMLQEAQLFNTQFKLAPADVINIAAELTSNTENAVQTLEIGIEIICPSGSSIHRELLNEASQEAQTARYHIIKWKQVQNQFKYDNQDELWDGEIIIE